MQTDSTQVQALTQFGQFIYLVTGTTNFPWFGAMFFFALIGQAIYLGVSASNRDVASPATPETWSSKFFIIDNWKRAATTILCIFVVIRFYPDLVQFLPDVVKPYFLQLSALTPMAIALAIGFGIDYIVAYAKGKMAILQVNRPKVMETIKAKGE